MFALVTVESGKECLLCELRDAPGKRDRGEREDLVFVVAENCVKDDEVGGFGEADEVAGSKEGLESAGKPAPGGQCFCASLNVVSLLWPVESLLAPRLERVSCEQGWSLGGV